MSLNPSSAFCVSCACATATAPDAKFSVNIHAFNGNTTNFNRCPAPKSSALVTPIQPREVPSATFPMPSFRINGLVRPM